MSIMNLHISAQNQTFCKTNALEYVYQFMNYNALDNQK